MERRVFKVGVRFSADTQAERTVLVLSSAMMRALERGREEIEAMKEKAEAQSVRVRWGEATAVWVHDLGPVVF